MAENPPTSKPPQSPAKPSALDHLPALDGLRGLAVLMVMWFHVPASVLPGWSDTLIRVLRPGYFGVDFFFVLSGFLITRILLDYRRRGVPMRVFFVRRFLRIFPAYYLLLAIMAVVAPSQQLWCCVVYLANLVWPPLMEPPAALHHLWSLSVEEHFYLVWPFLVCLLPLPSVARVVAYLVLPLSIGFAILFAALYEGEVAGSLIWQNTLPRSLSLAAGGLLAIHETRLRAAPLLSLLVACGVIVLAGAGLVVGKRFAEGDAWYVVRLVVGAALSTGVVAAAICLRPGSFAQLALSARPLRLAGLISYGLYLYHHPIYYAVLGPQNEYATPARAAAAVGLSFAVAILSYNVWEKPFLRLKSVWGSPVPKPRSDDSTAAEAAAAGARGR